MSPVLEKALYAAGVGTKEMQALKGLLALELTAEQCAAVGVSPGEPVLPRYTQEDLARQIHRKLDDVRAEGQRAGERRVVAGRVPFR